MFQCLAIDSLASHKSIYFTINPNSLNFNIIPPLYHMHFNIVIEYLFIFSSDMDVQLLFPNYARQPSLPSFSLDLINLAFIKTLDFSSSIPNNKIFMSLADNIKLCVNRNVLDYLQLNNITFHSDLYQHVIFVRCCYLQYCMYPCTKLSTKILAHLNHFFFYFYHKSFK